MGYGGEGKRKVVVVGGGIGGGLIAKCLQFDADVVLIDPKEFFEIPWANLRAMVEPSIAEKSVFDHSEYFTNGRIVKGRAVNITNTEVLIDDGQQIPYDYLVLATGHDESYPKTRAARIQEYKDHNEKIEAANSILIVGGGPTGVELAGEIAVDYPQKKVTLVHRGARLLEFIGPKASAKTLDWLVSKKVDVLLEQSVDLNSVSEGEGSKTYRTSTGETITADCHFFCVGAPLSTGWLQETVLKDCLDYKGRVVVDECFKVKGKENIFAIGDITDVPEIKQGYLAQYHSFVAAKNVKLLMDGGKGGKMATYKPSKAIALVSLGRKDGLAQFPFATMIGCIPGFLKSRGLFLGKTRRTMGLK